MMLQKMPSDILSAFMRTPPPTYFPVARSRRIACSIFLLIQLSASIVASTSPELAWTPALRMQARFLAFSSTVSAPDLSAIRLVSSEQRFSTTTISTGRSTRYCGSPDRSKALRDIPFLVVGWDDDRDALHVSVRRFVERRGLPAGVEPGGIPVRCSRLFGSSPFWTSHQPRPEQPLPFSEVDKYRMHIKSNCPARRSEFVCFCDNGVFNHGITLP